MARIPIGVRYTNEVSGSVIVEFTCRFCQHTALTRVRSQGTGTGTAYAFIGTDGAKSRAADEATAALRTHAEALAAMARCPACARRDEERVSDARASALGQAALLAAGGVAMMFMFPLRSAALTWLLPVGGFVLAFMAYEKARWKWEEVRERVHFLSQQELAQLEADPSGDLLEHPWKLAPIWVDTEEELVTFPFAPGVRLGVFARIDGEPRWFHASELGTAGPSALWRVALDNLQRATNQPLWQEASGVLRGRWGDGLAAARLVLPELLTPRGFSGPAVAFTTTEDTFLIAPANDDAALLAAFEAATTDVERVLAAPSGVDPFTAQPWLLVNGTWEPWSVPAAHPLAPLISALQARIDASR